ncbi:MAG: murein biosynthesis integral membrane protein MurJ [Bradymonadales bacterium]|nr:murein biosynthesis integral membrane protein MurJ [Bradymonadales bacterium]
MEPDGTCSRGEGVAVAAGRDRSSGFVRAFLSSALGTGLSRVAGAFRDIAIARVFGAGAGSDAFWVAYTVPNVFRRFVADEGLTGAVIPAVSKAEQEEGTDRARQLADVTFTALLIANLVLCVAGMAGAEWLVKAFAYEFTKDPPKFALAVTLTRWLFPFLLFVSLVSFFEGLLNHRMHFFIPKIAPGLVCLTLGGSALLLAGRLSVPEYALAVGVLVGGALHLLVNVPVLLKRWGRLRLSWDFRTPRFLSLAREMGKVVAIGGFAQINLIVLRQFAAILGDGAITRYWYANRLVDLSQGMIGVGIASALLPMITQSVAKRDLVAFRKDLNRALRLAGFTLLPVAMVLLTFNEPITAIVFRHGRYSVEDVTWTARTLLVLVPYLLAVAGINIVKKAFFALDDRNSLLAVGALGVAVTGGLGWWLIHPLNIVGLAWALSVSATVQLVAYLVILRVRLKIALGLSGLVRPFGRMVLATIPVGLSMVAVRSLGQWERGPASLVNLVLVAGGLTVAVALYLLAAYLLRIKELHSLLGRLVGRKKSA